MKKEIKVNDLIVTYEDTQEVREKAFEKLIEFFTTHESFVGECLIQYDEPVIKAPHLLAEIADDVIKFKVTYVEGE